MSDDETKSIQQVKEITQQIIPMLSGVHPDIVGGVLGELVGLYFAGHSPASRDEVKEAFANMVDEFTAIIDAKRRTKEAMTKNGDHKDWAVVFSDQAEEKMAEDPEAAAFVREHLARIRQVLAEHEAGRFATVGDALRSIGMEPVSALELGIDDDDQTIN
jgi:hypothetical protein